MLDVFALSLRRMSSFHLRGVLWWLVIWGVIGMSCCTNAQCSPCPSPFPLSDCTSGPACGCSPCDCCWQCYGLGGTATLTCAASLACAGPTAASICTQDCMQPTGRCDWYARQCDRSVGCLKQRHESLRQEMARLSPWSIALTMLCCSAAAGTNA